MDHTRPHSLAGKKVTLSLKCPHPMVTVYTGQIVQVLDWADLHTGTPWEMLSTAGAGEGKEYLRRLGKDYKSDPNVLAVTPIGHRYQTVYLIHESEVDRELP